MSSKSRGVLSSQISTNNVYAGMVDQTVAGKRNFAALRLPLVRIHVGDDGTDPPAMPEVVYGRWSFAALNSLVDDETAHGRRPMLNLKFAPDWMWTCTAHGAPGRVRDQSFATFANYMARLVAYYNLGRMTTETGEVIVNPRGTANRVTYWELWNEPDLDNETPCAPDTGVALTPAQYVTMWNAVTARMRSVDPTVQFVGPATAGGQFGAGPDADYFTALEQGAAIKPSALSYHGYGYWDNMVSDAVIFNGDPSHAGGIGEIVRTARALRNAYHRTPVWITEMNVNSAWGNDPYKRPWTAFGAAWWASAFSQLAPAGVALIHQYDIADAPQFGLIDDQTGARRLGYWVIRLLNQAFPVGSTRLDASSSAPGIQTLAARRPDGKLSVLIINRQLGSRFARGGPGKRAEVVISLSGLRSSGASLQQIDARTRAGQRPPKRHVSAVRPVVRFPGYGMAVLTLRPPAGPR